MEKSLATKLYSLAHKEEDLAQSYRESGNQHPAEMHESYARAYRVAADLANDARWDTSTDEILAIAQHNYQFVAGSDDLSGFMDVAMAYMDEALLLHNFLISQGWTPPVK